MGMGSHTWRAAPAPTSLPAARRPGRRYQAWVGLLFISPWIIGFILLKLAPLLASLFFSFTDFNLLHPAEMRFVGLANYRRVLQDGYALYTLLGTLSFALISIPLQMAVSLGLASLVNNARVRAKGLLRTLIFLPSIIPSTAILFMWIGFLDPRNGWLNRLILQPLGFPPFPGAFTEGGYNLLLSTQMLWSIGPGFLILYSALQSISPELYEAAKVDGAGPVVRFFNVTIPLISPALFFTLIINLISTFGGVALLDRGNPFSGSISAFDSYISTVIFSNLDLDYAASLSWTFFAVMMGVVIFLFRTSRRWVYYPEGDER